MSKIITSVDIANIRQQRKLLTQQKTNEGLEVTELTQEFKSEST
ncbi:MAG: spore germination protein GerM [Alphaproteobacteria bacterium]|jgi:spore germination protein GerM